MGTSIRTAFWAIPVEIALALATVAIIPQTTLWRTTYSGDSAAAAIADLSAGVGLMAAGSALIITDLRSSAGVAAILAGFAWLSADWAGWPSGLIVIRTLAMGIGLYYLPLILHLVALHQHDAGRLIVQLMVRVGYCVASVLAAMLLLFRDPKLDLHCWSNCTDDALLIGNQRVIAEALGWAIPVFELGAGGAIVLVSVQWVIAGSAAQRRLAAVVAIPALLIGIGAAVHGLALLADPHEGPRFALHVALFQTRAWAAALLAAGLGWTVVRASRSRSAVMRLAADLGNAPGRGALGPTLASTTGDSSLELLYWLPRLGAYVDAAGKPRELPPPHGRRTVTPLSNGGRLLGVATHDPAMIDAAGLHRLLGPAATFALENERLRAELHAEVEEVRASRARIVAAGDGARAQLERNLHDGAQQGLLAVAYELRSAAAAAEASGDNDVRGDIEAAVRDADAILAELRELAHGIHPAILEAKGLGPALRSLADRASIPLELGAMPSERLSARGEGTGYAIVAAAVDAAAAIGAEGLVVRTNLTGDRLLIEMEGLGPEALPDIEDRVGAADGELEREGSTVRAWIPCA